MQGEPGFRSGNVVLTGWTNVGKSTLLNRLVGDKIAAVAPVAQTTRQVIRGVANPPGGQIVFVDTPGLHHPRSWMNRQMVETTRRALRDVDLVLLVIDAARGIGPGDEEVLRLLGRVGKESIAVLNKVDLVQKKVRLLPLIESLVAREQVREAIPVSAETGDGCPELLARVLEEMPPGPPRFPEEIFTDQSERSLAAEWIREKILHRTRQELPHVAAVLVERWEEEGDLVRLAATILVERDSQKKIVIGQGGSLLKSIGTAARRELEELLGKKVGLELWVKTRKDWRNDAGVLRSLGLS